MSDLEAVDLERGAELLDECGWIQQGGGDRRRGFCAVEAVREAIFERTEFRASIAPSLTELLELTHLRVMAPYYIQNSSGLPIFTTTMQSYGVAAFNDTPGRTKEEVQDLLIQGAKKLREQGR